MSDESSAASDSGREEKAGTLDVTWLRWPTTWIYLALSGLDIFLTYQLLVRLDHVEANPLARYFIDGWGLKGMVWFKLGMTAFVLALVHTLLQKREIYAQAVVRLGVAVVFAVDCYSIWLLTKA